LKETPTHVANLDANEARELYALWHDRRHADQADERRVLIDALAKQMPELSTAEQLATGLFIQAIANETASAYARVQGHDQPPPSVGAEWA
jgi:hypothetical protein